MDKAEVRRKVESIPFEERKKRNNVEAAMFQYGFHTRNNKTRYRTLFKHGLQAIARCAWMNIIMLLLNLSHTLSQLLDNDTEPLVMLCVQYKGETFTAEDATDGVILNDKVEW